MYWSDWGHRAKIEKANYDGTQRQEIINSGIVWPNAISVDNAGKVLLCLLWTVVSFHNSYTIQLSTSDLYWLDSSLHDRFEKKPLNVILIHILHFP